MVFYYPEMLGNPLVIELLVIKSLEN